MVPWNSTSGGFAYIWQRKSVGIIAIKTEGTQVHFLIDVLVAVASLAQDALAKAWPRGKLGRVNSRQDSGIVIQEVSVSYWPILSQMVSFLLTPFHCTYATLMQVNSEIDFLGVRCEIIFSEKSVDNSYDINSDISIRLFVLFISSIKFPRFDTRWNSLKFEIFVCDWDWPLLAVKWSKRLAEILLPSVGNINVPGDCQNDESLPNSILCDQMPPNKISWDKKILHSVKQRFEKQ